MGFGNGTWYTNPHYLFSFPTPIPNPQVPTHDQLQEFGNQLRSGVVPFMFESLLSTHGEGGMVEDMYHVMGYLGDVTIRVNILTRVFVMFWI